MEKKEDRRECNGWTVRAGVYPCEEAPASEPGRTESSHEISFTFAPPAGGGQFTVNYSGTLSDLRSWQVLRDAVRARGSAAIDFPACNGCVSIGTSADNLIFAHSRYDDPTMVETVISVPAADCAAALDRVCADLASALPQERTSDGPPSNDTTIGMN